MQWMRKTKSPHDKMEVNTLVDYGNAFKVPLENDGVWEWC